MRYADKIKDDNNVDVWNEYCGFLNLSIEEYMKIQYRLMQEQMKLWCKSGIGKSFLKYKRPLTIDDFRNMVPLTVYEDYDEILLGKRTDMLTEEPVLWLQTTWEGGNHPVKVAPYTAGMLEVFSKNLLAICTLSASDGPGKILLADGDRALFGLAPFPFVTGLFPMVFEREINFKFLPPVKEAHTMSFSERNKKGFAMGVQQGIDAFFGMSSVISYITENFAKTLNGGGRGRSISKLLNLSPKMAYRYIKALYKCRSEKREILPKDLFVLKSLVCAGTDTASYKEGLEEAWGISPLEVFAGTEAGTVGTETFTRNGMAFFPDSNFYEFIPEDEMIKNIEDPSYVPKTLLMDQLVADYNYELVITNLKGGAFARYRVGDMFRCVSVTGDRSTSLPRLVYLDRTPQVIDIAGFTRITERSISDVVRLSGLDIEFWTAKKEYDEKRRPYLHMYVEMKKDGLHNVAVSKRVLREHLGVYFTYFDTDYNDLQKMLGIDPLKITILKCGTNEEYIKKTGKTLRQINPSFLELTEFLKCSESETVEGRWSM